MKIARISILLFFVTTISYLYSAPYKVSYFTADDGLSRNHIHHIFRDSRGFMWFSTTKGLDRFDGYDFIHFNSYNTENALPSDVVHCVEEDTNGNLWIGTENGLYFFEYKSAAIISANKRLKSASPWLKQNIKFIKSDENGNLWIGQSTGLSVINIDKTGEYTIVDTYKSKLLSSVSFYNGNIYIGDNSSVLRLIKTNNARYNTIAADQKLQHLTGTINVIFNDKNNFWIGTSNGLYKYDLLTEKLNYYQNQSGNINSLSSNTITDICKNNDAKVIIATLIGLNIYDYNTNSFQQVTSESYPGPNALNNNFVSCVLPVDEAIWVGTEKGGINLLLPEQSFFNNLYHVDGQEKSLSKNPVNAIFEDSDGDLLVGTVEGGLNIRRKGQTGFIHSYAQPSNPKSLSHNSVSAITQDFNGDYWIGTWGRGLNKLNYKNKYSPVFQQYVEKNVNENGVRSNFISSVVSDKKLNGLFIGSVDGLDFLDFGGGRFYRILNQLPTEKSIRLITGMLIDSKYRLWVGTGNGLFCIDLNKSDIRKAKITYKHFHYKLTEPGSTTIEKINCILESKDKKIWFGSNGNGIYSLSEGKDKAVLRKYDEQKGLTDNVVYGMLEDEAGTLWLSTDKGLCAFNPERKSFRSFTTVDGLHANQFYWDAYFKGSDGKMYFGHISGLSYFDPLKYTPVQAKNSVAITKIAILNEIVFPAKKIHSTEHLIFEENKLNGIVLHEADKAFSVEFSSLSYSFPDKIKYAYRLKGFDNQWKEVNSERRFASFTNIKNGKYELEIKCTNADGTWSDQIKVLEIKLIPPFYKTWWFILLLLAVIVYAVYRYSLYRINSLKRQEAHLRQLVDQRTSEIEQQKEKLEDQAMQLKQNMLTLLDHRNEVSRQNEMLVRQNHEITRQKEELEDLTRKVEEATIDKIGFFTNITHEFRTPITLILGPVERALKLSINPKVLEQLNIVKRNSRLLLSLINQLMDFRKIESGKMELTQTNQNFVEFLDDIILPFEDLVKDRGIAFRKQYRISPPEFLFDRDNMQKVLGNLLSNAIKFTPDRGEISVVASTYIDKTDQKEKLYVAVKDTGKGIAEDEKEKLFERFYQAKQNQAYSGYGQSGTGIGLFLCKRIIELHNGKIEALNLHSGGSCFRFIIPIERRLATVVALDGKAMEMMVASESENTDAISREITKGKPVLLIVEDNSDMRQYIRSIMSVEYNVLEASNGLIGLEITKRYQPDLIISDIMMPEMDGMELCKQLKSNFSTSHIPIILLTAKSSTDTQIESFHMGADAFLIKPFDEDLLKAMIRSLSEKRQRIQMSFSENMDSEVLNFNDESLDKKFMDKALKTIRDNYQNPDFDVTEFIDAMGISRSLLHKKLTNLAGQSASRFIRVYRLNIARELIIKNRATLSLNISEIAYEVGFNDPKYFTRCFTKHFGVQPSVFMGEKNE